MQMPIRGKKIPKVIRMSAPWRRGTKLHPEFWTHTGVH